MQGASLEEQRNRLAVFRRSLFSIFYIHILCIAQTKQFRSEADAAAAAAAAVYLCTGALRVGLARDLMEIS